jgi:hypothetical protein
VAVAVAAGQAAPEDGREPQGDLLGADRPDHGGEQVGLEHRPDPGEPGGDPGDHGVGRGQVGQRRRGGRERRGQDPSGGGRGGPVLGGDQQDRVGRRPRGAGGRPGDAAVHGHGAQPVPPVPAVEEVVAGPAEDVEAPGQVHRARHRDGDGLLGGHPS